MKTNSDNALNEALELLPFSRAWEYEHSLGGGNSYIDDDIDPEVIDNLTGSVEVGTSSFSKLASDINGLLKEPSSPLS